MHSCVRILILRLSHSLLLFEALRVHLIRDAKLTLAIFVVRRMRVPPVRIVIAGIPPGPSAPAAAEAVFKSEVSEPAMTKPVSAEAICTERGGLAKGRRPTEATGLESRAGKTSTGGHTPKNVAATHVTAEAAACSEPAVAAGRTATAATHLRQGRHERDQQDERRN
jgi:hypothetical protein